MKKYSRFVGRLLLQTAFSLFCIAAFAQSSRADESTPARHKPDARAWKADREAGQKALENKDAADAERYFRTALAEANNFSADDYRLAESLTDLGVLYARTGHYADAEPLMRRAVAIRKGDPHFELEAGCNLLLGFVCGKLGEYQDAEKAYLRAEEVLSRKLRPDHPAVLHCTFQRALLYTDQGDFGKAEPLLKKCVNMFQHPASRMTMRQTDPALHGVQVFWGTFKPDYASALEGLSRLASIYTSENRTADAESCLKDSLNLVDEYAAKDDPHLLATLDELSKFYVTTSNYPAAEPLMNRLTSIEKKKYGATNKSTLSAETALANLYTKENKNADASALFEELLPQDEQVFGPDNPVTTYTVEQLVSIHVKAGDYAKAEPLCRKQLEHAEKSGVSDVEILGILYVLGTIDTKLGHDDDLVSVRKQQLGIFEKMSGPDSPMLLASLDKYAKALRKIKNDAEAEKVEARAAAIKAARTNSKPANQ